MSALCVTWLPNPIGRRVIVAGLVVAAGPYREHATENILPLQVLLAAVFLATIGMLLNPEAFLVLRTTILLFCVVVAAIKPIGAGTAAAVFRRPFPVVVRRVGVRRRSLGGCSTQPKPEEQSEVWPA